MLSRFYRTMLWPVSRYLSGTNLEEGRNDTEVLTLTNAGFSGLGEISH